MAAVCVRRRCLLCVGVGVFCAWRLAVQDEMSVCCGASRLVLALDGLGACVPAAQSARVRETSVKPGVRMASANQRL
jgi:hypothetical protein